MTLICFLFSLLLFANAFAGKCSWMTPPGIQEISETTMEETDSTTYPSLKHTVNVSGIVSEADIDIWKSPGCIRSGIPRCFGIVYVGDTTKTSVAKLVILNNFTVDYEKESPMSKVVSGALILYPSELELNVGDSLYIKGYSAIYDNTWYDYLWEQGIRQEIDCSFSFTYYAIGEYYIFPKKQSLITPTPHTVKNSISKTLNRDASGRCLNGNKSRLIRY